MTESQSTQSTERGIPFPAVFYEVARVCEGCPSPRALLDPRDHCDEVEGARAIAMYLLHHPEVRELTYAMIGELLNYPRNEVEQYCALVETARGDNAMFSGFLDRMILRLRSQAGLDKPCGELIPAALRPADTSARVREILAQKPPRVGAALGVPVYVRGVTDDDTATESIGVPEDATVADLFRSPDEWQPGAGGNFEKRKSSRSKIRGRKARIAAVASGRAQSLAPGTNGHRRPKVLSPAKVSAGGMITLRVVDPQVKRHTDGTISFLVKRI